MKPTPAAAIPVSYAGEDFPSLGALARHLARRFGRWESTVLTYLSRHRGDVGRVVEIISIDRKRPSPGLRNRSSNCGGSGQRVSPHQRSADASACRGMRCSARCAGWASLGVSERHAPAPAFAKDRGPSKVCAKVAADRPWSDASPCDSVAIGRNEGGRLVRGTQCSEEPSA